MMNSKDTEYEKRYQENIDEMKKTIYSSAEYGADICWKLNEQDEVLQDASDKLESTDSILDKSIYSLRNMTWTGYVHNTIVDTSNFVKNNVLSYTDSSNRGSSNTSSSSSSSSSSGSCNRSSSSTSTSSSEYSNSRSNRIVQTVFSNDDIRENTISISQSSKFYSETDKDLEELSSAVETLHSMSMDIGTKLESQAAQIEHISERSAQLTDKALALTIQASKLVKNAAYVPLKFTGVYQFVDVTTGLYLTANGTSLLLSRATNLPTRFYCYSKGNNIYGLKSEMFMKYISTSSIWGNVNINSDTCGTHEECYIDFNDTTTGILMISRNWGSGGWLKRSPTSTNDGNSANTSFETIYETTSSLNDKTNMIRFAAIVISFNSD